MKTYYLWATILTQAAGRVLIADLVNANCTISPAAGTSGRTFAEGEASTLLSLRIDTTLEPEALLNRIAEFLGANGAMWHSLILHDVGGTTRWRGSNIVLPKREEKQKVAEAPPAPPATRFDALDDKPSSADATA